jgi:hypothetical protein
MVSAQQHLIFGKSHTARRCVDKISELTRSLSAVTTQLINLAGSGLYVKDGVVFQGLLNGRVDDPWMCGTDRVDTAFSRKAIVDQ